MMRFLFPQTLNYRSMMPWLLLTLVLTGCQTPIGVSRVDPLTVHQQLTKNVLSAHVPSIFSENVLRQYDLTVKYGHEPKVALAELHAILLTKTVRSKEAFALAELSFLYAEQEERRKYFLSSALYAFLFLFPEDPEQIPNSFDPRLRIASDLYNRGITEGLASDDGSQVLLESRMYALPFGELDLRVAEESLRWGDRQLTRFIPVAELEVRGLRNRYRGPGVGAPLAANQIATGTSKSLAAKNMKVPVTAVLLAGNLFDQLSTGQVQASLTVHVAYEEETITINNHTVPLEVETTSALAASLAESPAWEREIKGFLFGDLATRMPTQLIALQPYRPGRVPIVFVHGTASSSARWAEMVNDLMNDSCLHDRFQFWFFTYDTGNPILYSAKLLRDTLNEIVNELDPEHNDPMLREMVVIGHSQGGLLTKLMAVNPETALWDKFSDQPFDEMELADETRELLHGAFFFKALPSVTRVVFISTPHRGSYVAGNWLAHQLTKFIKFPGDLVAGITDVVTQNKSKVSLPGDGTHFSSVDAMTPGSPLVTILAPMPIAPDIGSHSIIAVNDDGPLEEGMDGVVAYTSAHLDDVDSELVVRSGHSSQGNPHTIQEVRRILLLHIGKKC